MTNTGFLLGSLAYAIIIILHNVATIVSEFFTLDISHFMTLLWAFFMCLLFVHI